MADEKLKGGVCCGACSVIILILLIAFSFDTVEPTEYGLKFNSFTRTIQNGTVYDGGRYWIWPWNKFLIFPRILVTIEFNDPKRSSETSDAPIQTRTQEGLGLVLSMSYQYQLNRDDLGKLFGLYNMQYQDNLIRISKDAILTVAGQFDAPSWWQQRKMIGEKMLEQINGQFQQSYASCKFLQLLQIDLPPTYEDSIVNTQVEVQKKQMKEYEQKATAIRSQISVLRSQNQAEITTINATAEANSKVIQQNATAEALNNTITAETQAYLTVINETGLYGEDLNKYVYYLGLMNQQKAKLLVGLDSGLVEFN